MYLTEKRLNRRFRIRMRDIIIRTFIVCILSVSALPCYGQQSRYEKSIPSEVLRRFNPEIVAGNRPRVAAITQSMILELHDKPVADADVYVFDFDANGLTDVEKEMLLKWIGTGKKILLWGRKACIEYGGLFPNLGRSALFSPDRGAVELADHPVNTDCKTEQLDFTRGRGRGAWVGAFTQIPADGEVIVSIPSKGVVAGRVPVKAGAVYFAFVDSNWRRGTDRDRWSLNFNQWMMGFEVPGATDKKGHAAGEASE